MRGRAAHSRGGVYLTDLAHHLEELGWAVTHRHPGVPVIAVGDATGGVDIAITDVRRWGRWFYRAGSRQGHSQVVACLPKRRARTAMVAFLAEVGEQQRQAEVQDLVRRFADFSLQGDQLSAAVYRCRDVLTLPQVQALLADQQDVLVAFWQIAGALEGRLTALRQPGSTAQLHHLDEALVRLALGKQSLEVSAHLILDACGALRPLTAGAHTPAPAPAPTPVQGGEEHGQGHAAS
ncbi:hypothetical protein GCM10010411_74630 [Actinomadura fulvescens]|uniref:Uncharacterized protein n=1 Tax=Actinomadura fulvescens TaxID=46160 RepID=A0ABP6CS79_9ACTN